MKRIRIIFSKLRTTERAAPGRIRQFTAVIVLNIIIFVLVLGGLEMFFRARQMKIVGPRAHEGRQLWDRFVGWRNNPEFSNQSIQHNAQGFRRVQDVAVEKSPGRVRMFLLGGSAAYGEVGAYPEIDDRFLKIYNTQLIDHYLEARLNTVFPSVRWEVINSAAVGYRLYQELTLIESVLLRYRPDYIILMDGFNDVEQIQRAQDHYDPYAMTRYKQEFDELANPQSFRSLFRMTQMLSHRKSALFRMIEDRGNRLITRSERQHGMAQPDFGVVNLSDLSTEEQAAFARARSQIGYYAHTARQINRILSLDGVTPLFLLQPALLLSHKPLTEREQRMYSAHRRRTGRASVYTYAQLYPLIADSMRQAATEDGFTFEDLTGVFDQTREQTFTDYCHLTPAANQMIAERIVSIMHNFFEKNARGASHTGGY